jgi:hypothetical protein
VPYIIVENSIKYTFDWIAQTTLWFHGKVPPWLTLKGIKLMTSKTAKQHHRSSTKETNKSNYNYLASPHRSNSLVETERINC